MKQLKRITKALLVLLLSVMLALTTLSFNTNRVSAGNAQDGYDVTLYHGYGRECSYPTYMSLIGSFTDGDYKFSGKTAANGYSDGPASGTTNNRYLQKPQGDISSIDFYYGDQMVTANQVVSSGTHCIKAAFYILNDTLSVINTAITSASSFPEGSTKIAIFLAGGAGDTKDMSSRWFNINEDVKVVFHYTNEHTITVNGVSNTLVDAEFDSYFADKADVATTHSTSTIISGDYTNASGLAQDFTLLAGDPLGSVSVSVGGNAANTSTITGVQYLASDYTFSDTHESTDILAIDFDNNQVLYYKVNADIAVNFVYSTGNTFDVTFLVDGQQYGSIETVNEGETVARPVDPDVPQGYTTFKGWYIEGTDDLYDFSSPVNNDLVLEAQFANVYSLTINNITAVSSTGWATATGGSLGALTAGTVVGTTDGAYENEIESGSNGFTLSFDYNTGIAGATISFGGVQVELTEEDFSATSEMQYNIDSAGVKHDTLEGTDTTEYIMKIAHDPNNQVKNRVFLRIWNINQDITIDVALKERKVTFVNLGRNYSSQSGTFLLTPYVAFGTNGANWVSATGGVLYASPKAAIDHYDEGEQYPGAHHQAVASLPGDYSNTGGVGGTMMTELEHLESLIFTYEGHDPIVLNKPNTSSGWNGLGTIYIDKDFQIRFGTAQQSGDLFKLAIASTSTSTISIRFFEIHEDITIEATYDDAHTIQFLNFGNATHDFIGTGAYSTSTSGSYVGIRCWDPYGISAKRNGGTIDYQGGIVKVYGDYSNSSGIGSALLVHYDSATYDRVVVTYGDYKPYTVDISNFSTQVSATLYAHDDTNELNTVSTGGTKIVAFVRNSNVEYYNVRLYNIAHDCTFKLTVAATAAATLNPDGTYTEKVSANLIGYDASYTATVDGAPADLVEDGTTPGKYWVALPTKAPAELTSEATVSIKDGTGKEVYGTTTSMKDYLYAVYNVGPTANIGIFSKTMLNYGAYCQVYFDVDPTNLANSALSAEDQNVDAVTADASNDRSIAGETDGITFLGQSLNLMNSTNLNVYFQITSGVVGDYVFKDGDTVLTPRTHDAGNGIYYVTIRNVAAPDLAIKHNFTVTKGGEGTLTVQTSVLSYANVILTKYASSIDQDKINLVRAMKALYAYNTAAINAEDDL